MKKLAITALLFAFAAPALAAEPAAGSDASDPMKGWNPPKVKKEKVDRAEIDALMKKLDDAGKKGDLQAAMALIDFPVLMTTDNSKGEAMGESWSADQYRKQMEPFYKPMPNVKIKHKANVFLISDSLATVTDQATVTMGNKTIQSRSALLLARIGGDWKIKSMTEGGWGDMMGEAPAATSGGAKSSAAPATEPAGGMEPSSTGSTSGAAGSAEPSGTGSTSGTAGSANPAPTTPPPSR